MSTQVESIISKLEDLSKKLNMSNSRVFHSPLGGGYLGHTYLEGFVNNFKVEVCISLDFLNEHDAVSLYVVPKEEEKENNKMKAISKYLLARSNGYHSGFVSNWENTLVEEIKIRTR